MHNLIEKNKKWLKCYSASSKILGWMIILFAVISIIFLLKISFDLKEKQILLIHLGTILELIFNRLPVGIILLGIGQLLKYIYEDEYQAPWLLRNGTKVLYLFALMAILRPLISYIYQYSMNFAPHLMFVHPSFSLANILILIGLGNILKRVMPVIEEHRSLV